MKKHNEGYTLVLVLVVLTVLSLLVSYVLTFSLRNLNTQKAAAVRVQDHYTAAGEIEAAIGVLEAFVKAHPNMTLTVMNHSENGTFTLETKAENQEEQYTLTLPGTATCETENIVMEFSGHSGSVRIDCELRFAGTLVRIYQQTNTYTCSNLTGVACTDYKISVAEGGGGE